MFFKVNEFCIKLSNGMFHNGSEMSLSFCNP